MRPAGRPTFSALILQQFHVTAIIFMFAGTDVFLSPSDTTVDQGQYAVFSCRYSCRAMQTHTLFWMAGDLPVVQRTFLRGRTSIFIEQSGLYVEVMDQSTCESEGLDQGQAIEQLRINGSSASLYNRTAIQCVLYTTSPNDHSFYSSYSILRIRAPGESCSYHQCGYCLCLC